MQKFLTLAEKSYLSSRLVFRIVLLIGAFFFACSSTFPIMVKVWSRWDYNHGFLVPFISLYLIWHERNRLRNIPIQPSMISGIGILAIGSLILILGKIGSVVVVELFATIIVIVGIVLSLFGGKYLKALLLPISYLIFMVPILDLVYYKISWPLQIISAKTVATLLGFFNLDIVQKAQYLELPTILLEIAPECSGISFLISFVAIGLPLAYFTQRSWLRRILFVSFAIFCCIFANLLRITLITLWSYYGGEYVHGPLHIFIGLFISLVGFTFLFIGTLIFAETPLKTMEISRISEGVPSSINFDVAKFNRVWIISIILLLCLGSYLYLYKANPVPLKNSLEDLQVTMGKWKVDNIYSDGEIFDNKLKGANTNLTRTYINPSGHEVKLHIEYFESQDQNKEFIHYTLQMLYDHAQEIKIPVTLDKVIRINKILVADGPENAFPVLYWYDMYGKIVANRYIAKFKTALDGLIQGRTNGAIVIVYSNSKSPKEIEQTFNDEIDFVKKIIPVLDNYLPGH